MAPGFRVSSDVFITDSGFSVCVRHDGKLRVCSGNLSMCVDVMATSADAVIGRLKRGISTCNSEYRLSPVPPRSLWWRCPADGFFYLGSNAQPRCHRITTTSADVVFEIEPKLDKRLFFGHRARWFNRALMLHVLYPQHGCVWGASITNMTKTDFEAGRLPLSEPIFSSQDEAFEPSLAVFSLGLDGLCISHKVPGDTPVLRKRFLSLTRTGKLPLGSVGDILKRIDPDVVVCDKAALELLKSQRNGKGGCALGRFEMHKTSKHGPSCVGAKFSLDVRMAGRTVFELFETLKAIGVKGVHRNWTDALVADQLLMSDEDMSLTDNLKSFPGRDLLERARARRLADIHWRLLDTTNVVAICTHVAREVCCPIATSFGGQKVKLVNAAIDRAMWLRGWRAYSSESIGAEIASQNGMSALTPKKNMGGHITHVPRLRVVTRGAAELDFKSAYPRLAIVNGVSIERYKDDRGGILPELWKKLLFARDSAKSATVGAALKLIANSVYGVISMPHSANSSVYSVPAAGSIITELCRAQKSELEQRLSGEFDVVHGNTDSIWVAPYDEEQQSFWQKVEARCKEFNEQMRKKWGPAMSDFAPLLMLTKFARMATHASQSYFAETMTGQFKQRGLVRATSCRFHQIALREMAKRVLKEGRVSGLQDFVDIHRKMVESQMDVYCFVERITGRDVLRTAVTGRANFHCGIGRDELDMRSYRDAFQSYVATVFGFGNKRSRRKRAREPQSQEDLAYMRWQLSEDRGIDDVRRMFKRRRVCPVDMGVCLDIHDVARWDEVYSGNRGLTVSLETRRLVLEAHTTI